MTTPQHFAHGYIISRLAGMPWPIALVGGFSSASLDIPIWVDTIKSGFKITDWSIRSRTHKISPMSIALYIVVVGLSLMFRYFGIEWWYFPIVIATLPFLHWGIDKPLHNEDPPYGWFPWVTPYVEIPAGILCVMYFIAKGL